MWTIPALPTDSLHHPVALGVVAAAAGVDPRGAAEVAAYGAIAGPATAAVRLLALDPLAVHALLADLAAECDAIAGRACSTMDGPLEDLPAATAPLLDISAEQHATWEVRLFAS
jgi:urease accessory protein